MFFILLYRSIFHLVSFKNPSAWETRTFLLLECCIYQPKNAKGCWQNQKFIYIYSISLCTWRWIYNYRSAVIFCQLIEDIFLLAICFHNCQPNDSIEYLAEFLSVFCFPLWYAVVSCWYICVFPIFRFGVLSHCSDLNVCAIVQFICWNLTLQVGWC